MIDIPLGLPDLVMGACIWCGIGLMFVIAEEPQTYRDKALRGYVNRHGRLPHWSRGHLAVVWGVLAWPVTFVELEGR